MEVEYEALESLRFNSSPGSTLYYRCNLWQLSLSGLWFLHMENGIGDNSTYPMSFVAL